MNKQLLTLTLGLILSIAPVCLAEEAVVAQDQVTEVSQPEAAPVVTETTMPSSDVVAPEQAAAPEIQPEEMNEEQLKAFLDQLVAELQKEEENKKKVQQDGTEVQATEVAPVVQ
jgi:hypothetical protein